MNIQSKPRMMRAALAAAVSGVLVLSVVSCSSSGSEDNNSADAGNSTQQSGTDGSSDGAGDGDTGSSNASDDTDASGDGELVYGVIGNNNDALYPYSEASSSSATMLRYEMYDKLTNFSRDGELEMALATKFEPSNDFKDWDVTLRDDVTMSDGSTFSADDVVASFKMMFDKDNPSTAADLLSMVDPDNITAKSDNLVHFTLNESFAPFPDLLAYGDAVIAGKDTTADDPVYSGPFKVESFTAGREADLVRNDDYWGDKPGFASLKILYFDEQDAVVNALLSGQIDVAHQIAGSQIDQVKGAGEEVLLADAGSYPMIEMRTDKAPFDDVRVRHAFQLMVNRETVVENGYGGAARIGNDYMAGGDSCPAPDVPQRKQDLDKAKQLLADAGVTQTEFTLTTDGAFPGMMESAQVLAQGAAEIGLKINIQKLSTAAFLDKWGEWPFYINLSDPPYILGVFDHFSKTGTDNTTYLDDPKLNDLLDQISATADPDELCTLITQTHKEIYENGGELIPAIPQRVTAYDSKVHGLANDQGGRASYMFDGVTVDS